MLTHIVLMLAIVTCAIMLGVCIGNAVERFKREQFTMFGIEVALAFWCVCSMIKFIFMH